MHFKRSPLSAHSLMVHAREHALWLARPKTAAYLRAYRDRQWWEPVRLAAFSRSRLNATLHHAFTKVPFYRKIFKEAGVPDDTTDFLPYFHSLPLSDKETLRNAVAAGTALADGYQLQDLHAHPTTGSTGTPFTAYLDKEAEAERKANIFRAIEWYGHTLGAKNARLWRTSRHKKLRDWLEQQVFGQRLELTIYDHDNPGASLLDDAKLAEFCRKMEAYRPTVIDGYVSALTLLAEYMLSHGIRSIRPRAVVTGAEFLSDYARSVIAEAFNCPVVNRYGGTEMSVIAHECGQHPAHALHIMSDRLHLEILRDGHPVQPGELGEIVITDFTARAVPMIRYRVGDVGILADPQEQCPCGRGLPLLARVEGRINDLFELPDGRILVSQVWHTLLRDKKSIQQYQVIQKSRDTIEVNVVLKKDDARSTELEDIQKTVQTFVPGCRVLWNVVDRITPGKGGKFRHTVSHVPISVNAIRTDYPPPVDHVRRIRPYVLPEVGRAEAEANPSLLKLDWNESPDPPIPEVVNAIIEEAKYGHPQWYADTRAEKAYAAIAAYAKVPASSIRIFNGSDAALDTVCRAFIGRGDEIIVIEPTYDQFRISAQVTGGIIVPLATANPWKEDTDAILGSLTARTRAIYLVNPNNPTGFLYGQESIARILRSLRTTLLIVDEAYIEFADHPSIAPLTEKYHHLMVVRSFSKAFAMAGVRCGYLISDPENLSVIDRIRNPKDINVFALAAATATLEHQEAYAQRIREIKEAREFLFHALRERGIHAYPSQANFLLIRVAQPAKALAALREHGILARDRSMFPGLEGCIRITVGRMNTAQKIIEAFAHLPSDFIVP